MMMPTVITPGMLSMMMVAGMLLVMVVDVAAMAMLGMVWLGARKLKQRLNVVVVGVEGFQGV
jgi:hypothetical protein